MKIRIITCTFIYAFLLNLHAQNTDKIEKDFIGQWKFIKMVDKNDKKLNPLVSLSKNNSKFRIKFPDWVFKKNGELIIDPSHKNPITAHWKWISNSLIEIIEISPNELDREHNSKKTEFDERGNYIIRDTINIKWITKSKIKIKGNKFFWKVYKKK
jgi:hypothetical protein